MHLMRFSIVLIVMVSLLVAGGEVHAAKSKCTFQTDSTDKFTKVRTVQTSWNSLEGFLSGLGDITGTDLTGYVSAGHRNNGRQLKPSNHVEAKSFSELMLQSSGTIAWTGPFDTQTHLEVATEGTLIEAINATHTNADSVTVNGVVFSNSADLLSNSTNENLLNRGTTQDSGYDSLLGTVDFGNGPNVPLVIGEGLLTPGNSYLIQVWWTDARNCCGNPRSLALGDGSEGTVALNSYGANMLGQYAVGFFTAVDESRLLVLDTLGGYLNAHITAYQIREVPFDTLEQMHAASSAETGIDTSYTGIDLAIRLEISYWKKRKVPDYELRNVVVVPEGARLLVMMEDESVVTLNAKAAVRTHATAQPPYSPGNDVGEWYIQSNTVIPYRLNADTINALTSQKATNLRIETTGKNHDLKIHKKSREDIKNAIECIQGTL